jgi:osmoprotectant transport system ATP-binding protein
MLMDEPFGAIDPIARERLQNEFLRLQAVIHKTIVFVTHDIDEAIKMGDRIAIMKQGGVLAQYATPEDLLMHPADTFVEEFVGGDRALKRLSLVRVGELDLEPVADNGQTMPAGASARDALSLLLQSGEDRLTIVDDGRPIGTLTIETIHATLRREALA